MEYKASEAANSGKPTPGSVLEPSQRPLKQNMDDVIPEPFDFAPWLDSRREELARGSTLKLFGEDHPDKEFTVLVIGGASQQENVFEKEAWLYQHKGTALVETASGESQRLNEGFCCVIAAGQKFTVTREPDSVGLLVTYDPRGNKPV
jgi:quercetin dioxygenase-like cupin family protein